MNFGAATKRKSKTKKKKTKRKSKKSTGVKLKDLYSDVKIQLGKRTFHDAIWAAAHADLRKMKKKFPRKRMTLMSINPKGQIVVRVHH